jgi:hypothetical protein
VEKKTIPVGVKVSPEMQTAVRSALARTVTGTISRFVRGCFESLIELNGRGARLAEPIQLLTVEQQRKLEDLKELDFQNKPLQKQTS